MRAPSMAPAWTAGERPTCASPPAPPRATPSCRCASCCAQPPRGSSLGQVGPAAQVPVGAVQAGHTCAGLEAGWRRRCGQSTPCSCPARTPRPGLSSQQATSPGGGAALAHPQYRAISPGIPSANAAGPCSSVMQQRHAAAHRERPAPLSTCQAPTPGPLPSTARRHNIPTHPHTPLPLNPRRSFRSSRARAHTSCTSRCPRPPSRAASRRWWTDWPRTLATGTGSGRRTCRWRCWCSRWGLGGLGGLGGGGGFS
jgi:hypothetical protein